MASSIRHLPVALKSNEETPVGGYRGSPYGRSGSGKSVWDDRLTNATSVVVIPNKKWLVLI